MKKSFLPLIALFFFFFASSARAQEAALQDVGNHPYKDAIFSLYEAGIVEGSGVDGNYKPDTPINRAEFNMILVRTLLDGEKNIPEGFNFGCFPDIPVDSWYTPPTCYSKEKQIVQGSPDGLFWPGNNITFAAAAKIIVKALNVPLPPAPEEGFTQWYEEFIYALSQKNAIPQSITRADQQITRAEMAEIIYLILNDITDQPSTSFNHFQPKDALACIDKNVPSTVDMQKVRSEWFRWTNEARAAAGLSAYKEHDALNYSGRVWSQYNASIGSGSMTHQRPGDTAYYTYNSIKSWFNNLGITFGGSGTQFTENITWGPFSCNADEGDCTDQVLKWTKSSFDHFLAEKAPNDAHRRSILNNYYEWIGLGLAVNEATNKYYVTIHYAKEITSQPDFCQ